MPASRAVVLIVDDEVLFVRSVADGFRAYEDKLELLTAHNGAEALAILGQRRVDLVVTDLKMPEMDGFELLAALTRTQPDTPVLVMTAFGTPDIDQRLRGLGVHQYLDKPLDFRVLADRVLSTLEAGASGAVKGIALPSFLQIVQLEQKSCSLRITSHDREGRLYFERGELVDAHAGGFVGDAAALEIVCWDDAQIEIGPTRHNVPRTVALSLTAVLMEGFRQKDEAERGGEAGDRGATPDPYEGADIGPDFTRDFGSDDEPHIAFVQSATPPPVTAFVQSATPPPRTPEPGAKETENMGAKDKLQELTAVEGFAGVGVFTPLGEDLALLAGSVTNIKDVGVLANNVLMNAQKASLEMGAGRGQLVHIEGEKAHILVRCLNEGTDPLKSQPQRAHIHTVLVLKADASIGMAKLKLGQVVDKLAEDFR
ncbi:MAG: response regulator [Polyangiaceae bacterium]|nr:response regulator [Polyangiaceae bacterium]